MKRLPLLLHFLFAVMFACSACAQTKNVQKTVSGNDLTESLNVPSGKTLTIEAGATINAAAGSTVTGFGSGTGTVTSVAFSGGTTGLSVTGSPITTSGTITLGGTLAVANGGTGITSLGSGIATWWGTPSSANLRGALTDETGTGAAVFATSPTITTPTISGAITWPSNTRQTFAPGAANAGLNVGALSGDPSSPSNGDLWYDSTANELTARINGANVALGAGGGGGSGTVTSVGVSGGTTGFAFTGSPVTTSGTITLTVDNPATVRSALDLGSAAQRGVGTYAPELLVERVEIFGVESWGIEFMAEDALDLQHTLKLMPQVDMEDDPTVWLPDHSGTLALLSDVAPEHRLLPDADPGEDSVAIWDDSAGEVVYVPWTGGGGGGGLTNITETLYTASPNNTVNVEELAVTGGTTKTIMALAPKGGAAFMLGPKPDGTATGGNTRGDYSTDLSMLRTAADQVGSGYASFNTGYANKSSGSYTTTMGFSSQSTSTGCVSIGGYCEANWLYNVAMGYFAKATQPHSHAHGTQVVADRAGMFGWASGQRASQGDTQLGWQVGTAATSGDSFVNALVPGSVPFYVPSGMVQGCTIKIVGTKTDKSACSYFVIEALIVNAAGTTRLVGSNLISTLEDNASTDFQISADDTLNALDVQVKGIDGEDWVWNVTVIFSEVK